MQDRRPFGDDSPGGPIRLHLSHTIRAWLGRPIIVPNPFWEGLRQEDGALRSVRCKYCKPLRVAMTHPGGPTSFFSKVKFAQGWHVWDINEHRSVCDPSNNSSVGVVGTFETKSLFDLWQLHLGPTGNNDSVSVGPSI